MVVLHAPGPDIQSFLKEKTESGERTEEDRSLPGLWSQLGSQMIIDIYARVFTHVC